MDTTNEHDDWARKAVQALVREAMRRAADVLVWIDDLYGVEE